MEDNKKSFTVQVKELLTGAKIEKSCCKKAYQYGREVFNNNDFLYIDRSFFKCASCMTHFLRGVFVSHGSVNAPDKSRHLEIKLGDKPRADELAVFLGECGFDAKVSSRKDKYIVYFKDGDVIVGFLSAIGAQKLAFGYLDVIIEKQVRNDCNRKSNFDTANIAKTVSAGKKHLEAINYFYDTGKLNTLSEVLSYTAKLKKENPALNLSELAEIHEPPITKSCVNHRLNKIIECYELHTGKKHKKKA